MLVQEMNDSGCILIEKSLIGIMEEDCNDIFTIFLFYYLIAHINN